MSNGRLPMGTEETLRADRAHRVPPDRALSRTRTRVRAGTRRARQLHGDRGHTMRITRDSHSIRAAESATSELAEVLLGLDRVHALRASDSQVSSCNSQTMTVSLECVDQKSSVASHDSRRGNAGAGARIFCRGRQVGLLPGEHGPAFAE